MSMREGPAVLHRVEGDAEDAWLGTAIAPLGDLDGDGAPDFAATSLVFLESHRVREVLFFSGRTGARIGRWGPPEHPYDLRWYTAIHVLPDLDGDGLEEVGVETETSRLVVFAPRTGAIWYDVPMGATPGTGTSMSVRLPDLDGDGVPELVIGLSAGSLVHARSQGGTVVVYSSRTGEILWGVEGSYLWAGMGAALAVSGDHDGDGFPDLLTFRDPAEDPLLPHRLPGWILVLSGRTGRQIGRYDAPTHRYRQFGVRMVALGDRDGNGFPEVAVAAPAYRRAEPGEPFPDPFGSLLPGDNRGWVGVYSLPELRLLYEIEGVDGRFSPYGGDTFGARLARAGDVDLDGVEDFLASTLRDKDHNSNANVTYLISGRTGAELTTCMIRELGDITDDPSSTCAPLGDVNGDGRPEFLLARHREDARWRNREPGPRWAGAVRVIQYVPEAPRFIRGDIDQNGRINLTDIYLLAHSMETRGGPNVPKGAFCLDAYDVDASRTINSKDVYELLFYFFNITGQEAPMAPAAPYPFCGSLTELWDSRDYWYDAELLGCASSSSACP